MNFLKRTSLKFKVMSLMLGLTTLLGLSAAFLVNRLANTSKDSILETFSTYANSLQASIAAQFYERYGDVQAFALNPGLQSKNREEIVHFLNTYSAMYGIYDLIMVVDAKGNLVAVNDKGPDGKKINVDGLYSKSFRDAPWFKAAINGQFTEDKERGYAGTFVEDAHVDPWVSEVLGEQRLGNSFSSQIKNSRGEVIGVITNRAGSRWFEGEFLGLYGAMKNAGLGHSELTMLSKDGTLLVDFDPSYSDGKLTHDFGKIGKLNLVQAGLDIALKLREGKNGKVLSMHARKKTEQATGFTPINDKKFIPSIGWSVIVRSESDEAFSAVQLMENFFYISFAVLSVCAALASIFFSAALSQTLKGIAEQLGVGAEEVFSNSEEVATASSALSSSTAEQAAALQETAASIDEVSAMVAKNADNAKKSSDASQTSQAAVDKGKIVVRDMIVSIEEINQSNANIMQEIETSNRQISEIVKVIQEIGEKTKVINDIVFQTKLLSFNASVEAARAGEHGKGFAVVAEEVGNLAQMSGNAAKEISAMLDGSIQKVERIVTATKSQVERLVAVGKEKVEKGTANANRCGEVLDEIVGNVSRVNEMVGEIATASREQAQGVEEITRAMNQLDQVTQQNTNSSQQCSGASEHLKTQADTLKSLVQTLLWTVDGGRDTSSGSSAPTAGLPAKKLQPKGAPHLRKVA